MHFHDDLLDSDASVSYSSPRKTAEKSASGQGLDADFSESYQKFFYFLSFCNFFMFLGPEMPEQVGHDGKYYSFTQRTW